MARAAEAGIQPDSFWGLTLRELHAAMKGARERDTRAFELAISQAWHAAAFARAERLPDLDRVLSRLRPQKTMTNDEMRAAILAINRTLGGAVIDKRKKP